MTPYKDAFTTSTEVYTGIYGNPYFEKEIDPDRKENVTAYNYYSDGDLTTRITYYLLGSVSDGYMYFTFEYTDFTYSEQ